MNTCSFAGRTAEKSTRSEDCRFPTFYAAILSQPIMIIYVGKQWSKEKVCIYLLGAEIGEELLFNSILSKPFKETLYH